MTEHIKPWKCMHYWTCITTSKIRLATDDFIVQHSTLYTLNLYHTHTHTHACTHTHTHTHISQNNRKNCSLPQMPKEMHKTKPLTRYIYNLCINKNTLVHTILHKFLVIHKPQIFTNMKALELWKGEENTTLMWKSNFYLLWQNKQAIRQLLLQLYPHI